MRIETRNGIEIAVFESGKEAYTNCGIIGIDEELEVSEGYDGAFEDWNSNEPFTAAERAELADYMIALWSRFKLALPETATTA